jgi:hypothetical protein
MNYVRPRLKVSLGPYKLETAGLHTLKTIIHIRQAQINTFQGKELNIKLKRQVDSLANAFENSLYKGDRVCLFLPIAQNMALIKCSQSRWIGAYKYLVYREGLFQGVSSSGSHFWFARFQLEW